MNDATGPFETQLDALLEKLRTLPPEKQAALQPLVDATRRRHESIQTATAEVQDALADWRIAMKYLVFTTEATRRERGA